MEQGELLAEIECLRRRVADLEDIKARLACTIGALRESEARCRALSDHSFEAIFLAQNGVCIHRNLAAETMFGNTSEEAFRLLGTDWIAPQYRELVKKNMQLDCAPPYEALAVRKDGTTFPCEIQGKMIYLEGMPIQVTAVRDITDRKKGEEALRKREQHYRALADSTLDVIWRVDLDLRFTYVNAAIFRVTGYTPDEWIGTKLAEHCDEESFMKIAQVVLEEVSKGADSSGRIFDAVVRKKNKDPISLEIHGNVILGETGLPIALQGVARDITDRKKVEAALRESEGRYRSVFNNAAVGINLRSPDGTILEVNQYLIDTLGYSREELNKLSYLDITHPDDVRISREKHAALERGDIDTYRMEKRYLGKNGRVVWVDISVTALRDSFGRLRATIAVIADISERKNVEQALRESEERYRNLVDISPDGILVGVDGRCVYANDTAARLWGLKSSDELIGKGPLSVIHPESWEAVKERMRIVQEDRKPVPWAESKYFRPDGTIVHAEVAAIPVVFQGEPGILAVFRDITERKRAEVEKSQLVATLTEALAQVKKLSGFLPICASCKKIRDDRGYWRQIEEYIRDHSEAEFSHGICPECAKRLYPGFQKHNDDR